MMKTLRVTLADLEGIPHATAAAATAVTVTAAYTGPVILTDGTIIPTAIKAKTVGSSGVVNFSVHASDDPAVREDHRGFAITVTAQIRLANGTVTAFKRTVKPLESMGSTVQLGDLVEAEGLPPQWVTVDEVLSDFGARLDSLEDRPADGYRHPRGVTEEAGDATYRGAFYGYGLSTLVPYKTRFNQLAVRFASTQAPVRVRVYSLTSMNAGALVPAGNGTTSLLLADVTLTSGYPTGSTPDEVLVDLGQDVTIDGGRYVVALITTTSASKITVAKWQTNAPGDRVGLWLATGADEVALSPGSLPVNGSTPPRLDYITPAVAAIADTVTAALAPFPVHDYIDVWTSPVFDDGRNVYVPGQRAGLTTAAAPAAKGDTTLTIAAGYGASPGMSFVTTPTEPTGQTLRAASVSGDVLTLAAPLAHPIASGQRLDVLWQNASHLSASSSAAIGGYAMLSAWVADHLDVPAGVDKITLLGNSWAVQGASQWAQQLGAVAPGATIVNAGEGGNTTAQMLARFDTDVPADSDIVLLFEHVNDSYQGVDAAAQAANWRALVDKVHAIGAWPVVIGPPPLSEHPTRATAQEHAATGRAGTSLRVLQLERVVAALQAQA